MIVRFQAPEVANHRTVSSHGTGTIAEEVIHPKEIVNVPVVPEVASILYRTL